MSLLEKIDKTFPGFADEVNKLSSEDLKQRVVSYAQQLQESEDHKVGNEQLAQAQAAVAELLGPYKDVKKAVKLKTQYILTLIAEKGG